MAGAVDGIFSGLSTSSIIDAIIKAEHVQVDLYTARQAAFTQKLASWQTLNTYLLGFKTQADVLAQANIWNSHTVTSSDETKVAATSTGSPATGLYSLSVSQLAQSQQIASQGYSESSAIVGVGTVEIKVGTRAAKTITLEAGSNSLEYLKNAINDADAGVTAAIINDGSPSNPYRLILSANDTGSVNQVSFTTNLSGGTAPDFTRAYFDVTEKLNWSSAGTSNAILDSSAVYTGTTNKTYTFTVQGNGTQTVGSGPITLGWSDGSHSGTITVNASGETVALTGDGSDGLALTFAAGDLVAGDRFQVQAQAPTIQAAQDAVLRFGADGSGGSAITVSSATNKVTSLIDGVTLNLKAVTTAPVQISVEADYSSISSTVSQFVDKYNAFADFADKQLSYSQETGKAGVLLGESSLITLLSDIRTKVMQKVPGLDGTLTKLSDVGIKFNLRGRLEVNTSVLMEKMSESPEEVRKLFLANGSTTNPYIDFVSSGAKTVPSISGYEVDITRAALQGKFAGGMIPDPSVSNIILDATNNCLRLKINGISSNTITLDQGTYTDGNDLAREIEEKINADQTLASNDVAVTWVGDGEDGYFDIRSTLWGANSKVEADIEPSSSAYTILGLNSGVSTDGADVAGTINGEPADGVGQILTGKRDNPKTSGLKLKITLTPDKLVDGAEGRVVLTRGYASVIAGKLESYTDPITGVLTSRATGIQKQIDSIKGQIEKMEAILTKRRTNLYQKYIAMEEALGRLQSQQSAMSAMFGGASSINTSTGSTK